MVGRLCSFWDGRCSTAMLNFQEVPSLKLTVSLPLKMRSWETIQLPFGAHPIFEAHIQTYANHGNIILVQFIFYQIQTNILICSPPSPHLEHQNYPKKIRKEQVHSSQLLTPKNGQSTSFWGGSQISAFISGSNLAAERIFVCPNCVSHTHPPQ